jgi:tetratricopeptide (TPR) repeat protein
MSGFKVQEPTLDEMLERCSLSGSDSGSDAGFSDAQGGEGVVEEEEAPRVEELEDESEASWKDVDEAKRSKEQGNKHYMAQELEEAVDCYSRAIAMCPEDDKHADLMSVFYGNRAAAYSSLKAHDLVIEDCSEALARNDKYVKVLLRRATALEASEKYEDAVADLKRVQALEPEASKHPKLEGDIKRLTKLGEEKMEKMKDEALGKLKELGNSILGNFGMSLDNFNMKQDPATGSWSMNMGGP